MIHLLMALSGFLVTDPGGNAIPGAWVGRAGNWFGATDPSGVFLLPDQHPDTITVHATGYADWTGPAPSPEHTVILIPMAVETGTTIHVTAARGSLEPVIPSTAVLSSQELNGLSDRGLGALNGRIAGTTVREYGGSMPVVSISLRGGDPGQVEYMVDGVSISSPRDGMPTGLFDPVLFSSLEIARGGGIPGNGASGSSGALNYLPPASSEPFFTRVSASSSGALSAAVRFSGTSLSLRRNVGSEGSLGHSFSFLTAGSLTGNLRGGILCGWAAGETETPEWTVEGDGEREQGQGEGWLNWQRGSLEADLSAGAGRMNFTQTSPSVIDDSHTDHSERASLAWKGPVTASVSWAGSHLESTATGDHSRYRTMLSVTGGTGFLYAFAGFTPGKGLSARATVEGGSILSVHCSIFTDAREPTMNDLYWPFDGVTSGNPDLTDERNTGAEAGAVYSDDRFSCGVTAFLSRTDDMILWLPDDQGIWTPSNLSQACSRGLEASAEALAGPLELTGTFTWNLATDETPDTPREGMLIPYRPELSWGAGLRWAAPESFTVSADISGMGKRFTNRTQSEYLDPYSVVDLSLSRGITGGITGEIRIVNLTDTDYQVTSGYMGSGRGVGFSINYIGE